MARSYFGGTIADWLFRPYAFGSDTTLAELAVGATVLNFYSAVTGGTHYTDLLVGGVAATTVTATDHQVPQFQGPDAISAMWVDKGDGTPRELMEARDLAGASTAAAAAAASATAAAASATAAAAAMATKVEEGVLVLNVKAAPYSAVGDGVANDRTAIQDAIDDAAVAGGTVYLPTGTYKISGADLAVNTGSVTLRGAGDLSILSLAGCGLVFDGDSGYLTEVGVHDMRITRTGSAGAALRFKGGGSGTGVAHFNASNVHVYGSTGECLLIDGSYIGTFTGCYFIAGTTGIKVTLDSGSGVVTGNNISFFGGETQGCGTAASLSAPLGVNFYGHGFEGSTTAGVDLFGEAYGCGFYGCYWESNAGYDLRVGNSGTVGPNGVNVHGGLALDGAGAKNHSIQLIRGIGIDIRGVAFSAYTLAPILVNEASSGKVQGEARNNTHNASTISASVLYTAANDFNKALLGRNDLAASPTGAGITWHKTYTITHDFGSVAANTIADQALTATGVATGDDVTVHSTNLDTGLMVYASVTAADTITLRVANVTTGAIDPAARNWRFRVWR